jgi:hypothetical protein
MAEFGTVEHLYVVRRASLVKRLCAVARIGPEAADRWVAQWEFEATIRGLDRGSYEFWSPAWDWISWRRGGR